MNKETYKSIVTKCWGDLEFKQRLIADPVETLRGALLPKNDPDFLQSLSSHTFCA